MSSPDDTSVITPRLLRGWPLPVPDGGKDSRGVALVIGGSRYTPGAVLLASIGALRAGAGVLQLAAAGSTAAALSIPGPTPNVESLRDPQQMILITVVTKRGDARRMSSSNRAVVISDPA